MSGDDDVPSCWICLEEGADQLGKPLVRDCSCRGDAAGFAHTSCIIQYAQRKSKDLAASDDVLEFTTPWEFCSFCHQPYQHELAVELANALLQFTEENFPQMNSNDLQRYFTAFRVKTYAIKGMDPRNDPKWRAEGKRTACKSLSVAQQLIMGGEILRGGFFAALAYENIGHFDGLTKESYKEGIKNYQRALDFYKSKNDDAGIKLMEANINSVKAVHEGTAEEVKLKNTLGTYEYYVRSEGEDSKNAIGFGLNHCITLVHLGHHIECERLASKLAAISLRVFGRNHDMAKRAASALESFKQRRLHFFHDKVEYEALQYDGDGDQYVVKQARTREPVGDRIVLRDVANCKTFTVAAKKVLFGLGRVTPVICHGLKNAAHLNGKIGDASNYNPDTDRYEVCFEDNGLGGPVAVKRGNLRIVFDLPPVAEEAAEKASPNVASAANEARVEVATAEMEARADEAAAALLAELDLEESKASTGQQQKRKKKKGKKNRKK